MKDKAFDAGQVKALTELLEKVNAGMLSAEQGGGVMLAMFPGIKPQIAAEMIKKTVQPQEGMGGTPGASPQGGAGEGASAPGSTGNQTTGENNA
jgi:hypothetical protein